MKPFTGYIFLATAITCGIAANSFAKISDGFSKLTPSIACLLLMCVTMFSLAKGMSAIPVGVTYASFAGLCIIATIIVGVVKFNQMPDLYTILGMVLIISGVLIVNLIGKTS